MSEDPFEQIEIKCVTSASLQDMIRLYKDAGWWQPSYDRDSGFLMEIVKNSALFAGAFQGNRMVGMGRALSDNVSDAYIQDVVVRKTHRGKGIGKKIIGLLVKRLEEKGVDWIGLVAEPDTNDFYKQLGFEPLKGHTPLKYKGKD